MRILLIKLKHIGDSLILTPTIAAIKQARPDVEIWVVVRRGCEGILAGCPEIARILTVAGVEKSERRKSDLWRTMKMLVRLWFTKFDYVFELGDGHRGRLYALLSRTERRYSVKPSGPLTWLEKHHFTAVSSFDWQACHRIEKDFYTVSEFLPLQGPIPPLRFAKSLARAWEPGRELTNFCVVQVGTRQGFNRWHREGWLKVCREMLEQFANVVVSCGPVAHEREEAAWLQQELGARAISTEGKATWSELAWLLGRAKLYVGPNTAAMHLAAACGCPVVALFGPSIEDHWHPWQVPYRIVTTRVYASLADPLKRHDLARKRAMADVEVVDVIAACDELLAETQTTRNG